MSLQRRAGVALCCSYENQIYFLAVHEKASGFWGFPKGHVEQDELDIDCAYREFREELGLELKRRPLGKVYHGGVFFSLYIESVSSPSIKIKPDYKEISSIQWITLNDLKTLSISNSTRKIISKLEKRIKRITIKSVCFNPKNEQFIHVVVDGA